MQAGGLEIDAGMQGDLAEGIVALAGAIGGLLALYGRLNADKRLG